MVSRIDNIIFNLAVLPLVFYIWRIFLSSVVIPLMMSWSNNTRPLDFYPYFVPNICRFRLEIYITNLEYICRIMVYPLQY